MAEKLLIVGGGGFATEVCWLAEEAGWDVLGYLDDAPSAVGRTVLDKPVLGPILAWREYGDAQLVVAIGAPRARQKVVEQISTEGTPSYARLVHPSVRMSRHVALGEGAMITAGCVLTTEIVIGRHAIVNLNATVGHDCRFGDFVTIAPMVAISGNIQLEDLVEVGTGAAIRQGLTMARGSMLGMGGVLTKFTEPNGVYVGNPAKLLKMLD